MADFSPPDGLLRFSLPGCYYFYTPQGKCETNPKVMSRICRLSCDLCRDEEETKTTTKTTTKVANANTVAKPQQQEQHQTISQPESSSSSSSNDKSESKKKKKAKIDAETGLECVDLDPQCPLWAATVRTSIGWLSG